MPQRLFLVHSLKLSDRNSWCATIILLFGASDKQKVSGTFYSIFNTKHLCFKSVQDINKTTLYY